MILITLTEKSWEELVLFINKQNVSVRVADMLINNVLFKQDVFNFNDTTRNGSFKSGNFQSMPHGIERENLAMRSRRKLF